MLLAEKFPNQSLKEVLASYKHIKLTKQELQEIIIEAKRKKELQLQEQVRRKREEENRKKYTQTEWDVNELNSFMEYRMNNWFLPDVFELDEANQCIYEMLLYYFSNDQQFVPYALSIGVKNPSLDKGIMLCGNPGVGKSWMMELFSRNRRQCYKVLSVKMISDLYEKDGAEGVAGFEEVPRNPVNDVQVFYQPFMGFCFDDMGTDDEKRRYGNRRNVIGDIIENRYHKSRMGIVLHATTNLPSAALLDFYGARVHSRLRGCMNFIELSGEDRRK
jgi:DNA replication protein DnaC